jgi:hypothetical protein
MKLTFSSYSLMDEVIFSSHSVMNDLKYSGTSHNFLIRNGSSSVHIDLEVAFEKHSYGGLMSILRDVSI